MMQNGERVSEIAHLIQLAVAPVFLLSGVGAILAVLTNRLARIVDRARQLEVRVSRDVPSGPDHDELSALSLRARLIGRAVTLCTTCALLVCAVIAALFLGAFLDYEAGYAIAGVFIAAMLALIAGLIYFLKEIFVATRSIRIGPP